MSFQSQCFITIKIYTQEKYYSTCGNLIPLPNTTKISVYLLIFDAFQAFALFHDMTLFNYTMTFLHILTIKICDQYIIRYISSYLKIYAFRCFISHVMVTD